MGKTGRKTYYDARTETGVDSPVVMGIRCPPSISGHSIDVSSPNFLVVLDKRNPKHIDKFIKFVKTLDERKRVK